MEITLKKKLLVLLIAVLALGSLMLWARPSTILCPLDGETMKFYQQMGSGPDAHCWYSHKVVTNQPGVISKTHAKDIPCGD